MQIVPGSSVRGRGQLMRRALCRDPQPLPGCSVKCPEYLFLSLIDGPGWQARKTRRPFPGVFLEGASIVECLKTAAGIVLARNGGGDRASYIASLTSGQ